jgi:hypothetical protein
LRQVQIGFEVAVERNELAIGVDGLLGGLALLQSFLRLLLIVPKIGSGDARFELI